jgi:hypothetical protein
MGRSWPQNTVLYSWLFFNEFESELEEVERFGYKIDDKDKFMRRLNKIVLVSYWVFIILGCLLLYFSVNTLRNVVMKVG